MTQRTFKHMNVDELVELFESIALKQDHALLMDEISKYNRLYDEMEALEQELKGREGDARSELLRLFKHRNPQVRLKAASATLAVDPQSARATLQAISDAKEYPQAASARSMMRALDEGRYVPS